jgi:hypothetical protein
MIDPNKLSLEIKDSYGDSVYSAELTVYFDRDGKIFKHRVSVDFMKDSSDYQYSTTTRPVQIS